MNGGAFPPILCTMALDRRLSPTDIRVFIVASQYLDFIEYRVLKVAAVAHALRAAPSHVAKAMRRLTMFGYLDRAPRAVGGPLGTGSEPARYRIPYSARAAA